MSVFQKYIPKKFGFRKVHKQLYRLRGFYFPHFTSKFVAVVFYRLQKSGRLKPAHYETFRRVVKKVSRKQGRFFFNFFCDLPVSRKKGGLRMGKGKGQVEEWVSSVKKGALFSSIIGLSYRASYFSFLKAKKKIPIKGRLMCNRYGSFRDFPYVIE